MVVLGQSDVRISANEQLPAERIRIGTAGWRVPQHLAGAFVFEGSHLERYAHKLPAVEINSSFYRPHRPATYARWAANVPARFRFAVKAPREVTHTRRLVDASEPMRRFLEEVEALGPALGPLLVQLPPSLSYDQPVVERFLARVRECFSGNVAFEPRHPTWFVDEVEEQLVRYRVARVAADPSIVPKAALPGGWPDLAYWRLHGSPKVYYSAYGAEQIEGMAQRLERISAQERWCIFDNTALGHATGNALTLSARLTPYESEEGI